MVRSLWLPKCYPLILCCAAAVLSAPNLGASAPSENAFPKHIWNLQNTSKERKQEQSSEIITFAIFELETV